VSWQVEVTLAAQLPPVHTQPVAAGEQLAVSVMGLLVCPTEGPVTVQLGAVETTQARDWFGGLPVSVKLSQF
jgi:hypothetical protein